MTISKELFLAILSMDAYDREYRAGLADGGEDDKPTASTTRRGDLAA